MNTFIILLIVLSCLLMVAVVLVQNSKGGGLAANFASGNQAFGVRKTADILEKASWILICSLFVFCFLATAIYDGNRHTQTESAAGKALQNAGTPSFQTPGAVDPSTAPSGDSLTK